MHIFGINAQQTSDSLIIKKADLGIYFVSAKAEVLLAAILKKAFENSSTMQNVEVNLNGVFFSNSRVITVFQVSFFKNVVVVDDEIQDDFNFNVMDY